MAFELFFGKELARFEWLVTTLETMVCLRRTMIAIRAEGIPGTRISAWYWTPARSPRLMSALTFATSCCLAASVMIPGSNLKTDGISRPSGSTRGPTSTGVEICCGKLFSTTNKPNARVPASPSSMIAAGDGLAEDDGWDDVPLSCRG